MGGSLLNEPANAGFIVASNIAMPRLIAEVRMLKHELETLKAVNKAK